MTMRLSWSSAGPSRLPGADGRPSGFDERRRSLPVVRGCSLHRSGLNPARASRRSALETTPLARVRRRPRLSPSRSARSLRVNPQCTHQGFYALKREVIDLLLNAGPSSVWVGSFSIRVLSSEGWTLLTLPDLFSFAECSTPLGYNAKTALVGVIRQASTDPTSLASQSKHGFDRRRREGSVPVGRLGRPAAGVRG